MERGAEIEIACRRHRPEGATRDKDLMRFLISQCIQKKFQIEIGYQEPNTTTAETIILEPYMMMDTYLNAFQPATRQEGSYSYAAMLWMLPTRRPFTYGRP